MATYTKRKTKTGYVWRVQVVVNGKRLSATRDTKRAAEDWASEQIQQAKLLKEKGITHSYTLKDALLRYCKEVSPHKKGAKKEILRLNAMARHDFANIKLAELTSSDIAKWRDDRLKEVSASSVRRDMNILVHCLNICIREWQWLKESPAKSVTKPKEAPPRNRLITDDEIQKLLFALNYDEDIKPETIYQRIAVAFLFAIETGMREGEICTLTNDSIKGRVARLSKTKNGFPRDVPLSKEAIRLWKKLPGNGFELTPTQIDSNFRKAKRKVDLNDIHFHDTRHLAVTRLSKKLDVLALAKMIGHKDLKQLQTYYDESPEEIAKSLD